MPIVCPPISIPYDEFPPTQSSPVEGNQSEKSLIQNQAFSKECSGVLTGIYTSRFDNLMPYVGAGVPWKNGKKEILHQNQRIQYTIRKFL